MAKEKLKDEQGSVLIMAVVLAFASILLGVAFLTFAVTLHDNVSTEIARAQAVYDGKTGVMYTIAAKVAGRSIPSGWVDFYENNGFFPNISLSGNEEGDINVISKFAVSSIGKSTFEGNNVTVQVSANYNEENYSDYLYISHRERDSVRHVVINFWSHDTLDGKVHSNDTIHMQPGELQGPVFYKKVTSTRNAFVPQDNHARFVMGKGPRAKMVFPDQANEIRLYSVGEYGNLGTASPESLTQLAISGNMIYHRKCGLYHHDGTDSLRCDPPTIGGSPYLLMPPQGCMFVYGKVMIEANRGNPDQMGGEFPERNGNGESFVSTGINGQLTIGSMDTMIIGDNIIYMHARPASHRLPNSTPTTLDSCPDILGLVSERYIMISRLARPTTYVNAALAAVVGSISVQDIYNSAWPVDNEKQSLVIWGSLAQRNRGIVHTTDNPPGRLRGCIEKDYHYDIRFQVKPPPHFMKVGNHQLYYHEPLFLSGTDGGGGG